MDWTFSLVVSGAGQGIYDGQGGSQDNFFLSFFLSVTLVPKQNEKALYRYRFFPFCFFGLPFGRLLRVVYSRFYAGCFLLPTFLCHPYRHTTLRYSRREGVQG